MEIKRNGSLPSGKGPEDWFTGTVRLDNPFAAEEPARVAGATVTFEPGARTAWHTHPLGQTLVVIAGSGWVQNRLVRAGRKTLARSNGHHRDEPHRDTRAAKWEGCRLDGES
jgi:quercetin dioxygenase-like cupin family protein